MRKNRNMPSEAALHRIIRESVRRVINESSASSTLEQIKNQLIDLADSGYIPFSSPAPSSTEQIVKENVLQAIDCLEKAISADRSLY